MDITLSHFGGIIPRLADHMLGLNQATIAHDAKLRNGRLEAWREPEVLQGAIPGARTIYQHNCCWLSWVDNVHCTAISPDWNRLYLTGREGRGLEVAEVASSCEPVYLKAGVPAPTEPLKARASESCGRDVDARSYVYTYVNIYGEESAPSPPSNIVRVADGATVSFPYGFPVPPEGYGITEIYLYRSATGFRPADGKTQTPLTEYLFVGNYSVVAGAFDDSLSGVYLGAALETREDRMPPDHMQGVVALGDQVRLAGFVDNRVHFSEPFQPHNWPAKYDLTLDYNVVHMLAQDQRLFVTTANTPYIIDASGCDPTKCTPVASIDIPLGDIGCNRMRSAIMTRHGMIYATRLGLVLLQGDGQWHIITVRWFGEDDWCKIKPHTIRLAYWEGFLFFATDVATFLLNIDSAPYKDMEGAELVTLSDKPVDMLVTETGRLVYLEDDKIKLWDAGDKYRPYIWQSRPLSGGRAQPGSNELAARSSGRWSNWWPTSVKLGGNADFALIDSRGREAYRRFLYREEPRRLPRVGRHLWYQARLSGTDTVYFFNMGTSIFTVNAGV